MPAGCNAKNAIRNERRNDLDRLNNFSLCQFSTLFLAPGEYSVPVWSTSRVPAVWKVQRVYKEGWNSWSWLTIAHLSVLWPEMLEFTVLLLHAGSKSVMVINHPLLFNSSSRAEASGADTMGCCVRGRSRWSEPEPSGCWHCVTLVGSAHGSRCFGVCVFVGGQLRVWTVSQTPASDLLSSKFVHKARKNDTMAGCLF